MLLQVHAHAAEEHAIGADVLLVGDRGRVDGLKRDIVAATQQFPRQRVVAQATAAIHVRGACRNGENPHTAAGCGASTVAFWNARARNRKSMMLPSCGWSQFN